MIEVFGAFSLLIAAGFAWKWIPEVPSSLAVRTSLSNAVMFVFLPPLTFLALYRAPINPELWKVPLLSAIVCISSVGIAALFLCRAKRVGKLDRPTFGALLLASGWANATYLGHPTITAKFGEPIGRIAVLFDLLSMTPLLLTLGTVLGLQFGKNSAASTRSDADFGTGIRNGVKSIAKLPPFWGLVLGLGFNVFQIPVPAFVIRAFTLASNVSAPVMIFSIGLALQMPRPSALLGIMPSLIVKLAWAPILGHFLAKKLGLQGDVLQAVTLETAMPTMILTLVISDRFGLNSEILAQAIAVSTLISFFTLSWIGA